LIDLKLPYQDLFQFLLTLLRKKDYNQTLRIPHWIEENTEAIHRGQVGGFVENSGDERSEVGGGSTVKLCCSTLGV
jgi:hypothetical protein